MPSHFFLSGFFVCPMGVSQNGQFLWEMRTSWYLSRKRHLFINRLEAATLRHLNRRRPGRRVERRAQPRQRPKAASATRCAAAGGRGPRLHRAASSFCFCNWGVRNEWSLVCVCNWEIAMNLHLGRNSRPVVKVSRGRIAWVIGPLEWRKSPCLLARTDLRASHLARF